MGRNLNLFEIIAGVLLALVSILVIVLVLSQRAKTGGMGALGGMSENYANVQSRSVDAKAATATKYAAIALFVLAIAVSAVSIFVK